MWLDQNSNANYNGFKHLFETRLDDIDRQNWCCEVSNNSQSTNYRIFKDSLRVALYLTILDNYDRIILCRFRCRNHNLPCNTNIYNSNVDVNENTDTCVSWTYR